MVFDRFMKETTLALHLGFKGKQLVHPTQIEFVNEVFSFSAEEIQYSRRLVEAFAEAQAKGLGAMSFEGKMIHIMSYRQARKLANIVEIITEKEKSRRLFPSISI